MPTLRPAFAALAGDLQRPAPAQAQREQAVKPTITFYVECALTLALLLFSIVMATHIVTELDASDTRPAPAPAQSRVIAAATAALSPLPTASPTPSPSPSKTPLSPSATPAPPPTICASAEGLYGRFTICGGYDTAANQAIAQLTAGPTNLPLQPTEDPGIYWAGQTATVDRQMTNAAIVIATQRAELTPGPTATPTMIVAKPPLRPKPLQPPVTRDQPITDPVYQPTQVPEPTGTN